MVTVTTTTGQARGDAVPPAAAPFNLPYADNFKSYNPGRLAKYFSDMYGAFETAPCDGGRTGVCLSQLVPREPIAWKRTDNRPFTILGNLDWTDYTVSTDVLFEQPGSADLIGRLTGMSGADIPNSYVLRVADTGAWSLRRTSTAAGQAHPGRATSSSPPEPSRRSASSNGTASRSPSTAAQSPRKLTASPSRSTASQ